MHFIRTIKSEQELNLNGEMWYISDIIQAIKSDIENVINEYSLPVKIDNIELIGSYMRGENTSKSDLDILVQYSGDIKDDSLFDILSAEPLELNGVKIDINPINSAKDSIEDFKERNKGFSKKKSEDLFNCDFEIIGNKYYYQFLKNPNKLYITNTISSKELLEKNKDIKEDLRQDYIVSVSKELHSFEKQYYEALSKAKKVILQKYNNLDKLSYIFFRLNKINPISLDESKTNLSYFALNNYFYNGVFYTEKQFKKDLDENKKSILDKIIGLNKQDWHKQHAIFINNRNK